jgi:LacI family transcriptional regulator
VGIVWHPVIGAKASEGYHLVPLPNEELAAELANKLAAGHPQEFVIVAGPDGLLTSDDRVRGFQRDLAAAGMPTAEVMRTRFDRSGGYKAGLHLSRRLKARSASSPGTPLCILTGNDVMAIGAATALHSRGIPIPRDASIAGFDGTELLRDFRPALSTVRLPLELIGHLATVGEAADGGFTPPIEGEVVLSGALA